MAKATGGKFASTMSDLPTNTDSTKSPEHPSQESSLEFAAASQPSYARTLFFGSTGLRPGWGFAFYAVMFYVLQQLADALVVDFVRSYPRSSPRLSEAVAELTSLLAALIPAVILARVEKRAWGSYGLPLRRSFGKLFGVGAIWGFCSISLLIISLYTIHDFSFGRVALHGMRIAKFAAYWSVMFVLVGLFEEFLLRGYTQFTLARGVGFWPAAAALSITFGLVHLGNEGEHWPGLVAAALIGLFFCLTLRRTGNLWFAVGFHAAWDWGESFFYSVPDSGLVSPGHLINSSLHGSPWLTGGTVGPEGSVLCFAVIIVTWLAFHCAYPVTATSKFTNVVSDSGGTPLGTA
jgi:membrane protease YdiL (CAAX protease family)